MSTPPDRQALHRPQFHYSAQANWLNDPNGLVWLDGEYHLFYQYNPFGDQWGHMSWGHAVSPDLVNWTELPVAIPEDGRTSIFSGSVVVDVHNRSGFGDGLTAPLVAIYTGCLRRDAGGQAQELAYSTDRGRTWQQHAHNPVLDLGLRDFRDPKVFWHAPTARWVMAVVLPDERCALFYASQNLKDWQPLSRFDAPFESQGIWECPDLIPLTTAEGEHVWLFKVDVFGGHPSGDTGARIFFGQFDGTHFTAEPEDAPQWADYGADFYAALSWAHLPTEQPHPIWLAWLNCHRYAKHLPTSPWRGSMSVPRTLHARRGPAGWQLLQRPWPGLQALRGEAHALPSATLHSTRQALTEATPAWRHAELVLTLKMHGAQEAGLCLQFGPDNGAEPGVDNGGTTRLRLGYDAQRQAVFVDRGLSGFAPESDALYVQRRWAPGTALAASGQLRLRVLLDRCSVEVFVGDGEVVLTEQLLPGQACAQPGLYAVGGTASFSDVACWPLKAATFDLAPAAGFTPGPVPVNTAG